MSKPLSINFSHIACFPVNGYRYYIIDDYKQTKSQKSKICGILDGYKGFCLKQMRKGNVVFGSENNQGHCLL